MAREGAPRPRTPKTEAPSVGTPEVVAQMMQELDAQPQAPTGNPSPETPKARREKTAPAEAVKKPRARAGSKASADSRQTKTIKQGRESISVQTRDGSPVNISTGDTHNHISGETPYRDYSLNTIYEQAEPIDTAAEPIENTQTKRSIRETRGPLTPNDIPDRTRRGYEPIPPRQSAGPTQPSAPYTPTATFGGDIYNIVKGPGQSQEPAPAAPLDVRSPANTNDNEPAPVTEPGLPAQPEFHNMGSEEELPEDIKLALFAQSDPSKMVSPAALKKFEGLLKNKEDLQEIDALADTLAAAHAKEASFNTPMRRVFGWMSRQHREGKKTAIAERDAAQKEWWERLRTHANSVYGQVEQLSAKNPGRLMRYRGLMTAKLIVSQTKVLEQKKAELLPPSEKGMVRKAVEAYGRVSPWVKVPTSALLVTGAMAATGGIAGVSGIALYGASRLARTGVGVVGGVVAAKAATSATRHLLRWRAGLKGKETRRDVAKKQIALEARKNVSFGKLDEAELKRMVDLFGNAITKERRDELYALLSGAAAGAAVGGLTALTAPDVPTFRTSGTPMIPDIPAEETGGVGVSKSPVGREPMVPDIPAEETGGAGVSKSAAGESRGRSGAAPLMEPQFDPRIRTGPAVIPYNPGAPEVPSEPPVTAPPSVGEPMPKSTAPAEVPPVESTPKPSGTAPEMPATDSAPSAPPSDIPPKHFGEPIVPAKGDNVWSITEKRLAGDVRFDSLNRAQQDYVLDAYWKHLQAMGPDELKKFGFTTRDVHKIFPGQALNLSAFDNPALQEKVFAEANALSRSGQENILRARGYGVERIKATLDVQPRPTAPIPETPPAVPSAPESTSPPQTPETPPSTPSVPEPTSLPEPPELPPLPQPPSQPTTPDVTPSNPEELEVERERAGVELAEQIREREMAPVIEQANTLSPGEAYREQFPGIERNPADPKDYSAQTGTAPVYNPDQYGGLSESQLEGMSRTQTLNTITDYFGSRGLFIRNEGMAKFGSIAWRDADAFIRDVRQEPETVASSINMDVAKLQSFVEFLEQGAKTYNVPVKGHNLSAVLESVVRHGVERSVSNTVLP